MRKPSASRRYRSPSLAPQMRTAFARIAWKTALSSPGELEMTRSTSEVAVCCSRVSASSRLYFSSCCSRSVCDLRVRPTRVLTFVPLERGLRTPVLFAPLRDKVTPFLSLVDLCWLLSFDHLVSAGKQGGRNFDAKRPGRD